MKTGFRLIVLMALTLTAGSSLAHEYTVTTSAANTVSSKASLEIPELFNNPVATPTPSRPKKTIEKTSMAPPPPSPTPVSPIETAGGDLSGTYPNPTVQKLLGRNLSNIAPKIGQILKWNGTEWIPADDDVAATNSVTPTSPIQTFFKNGVGQKSPEIPASIPLLEGYIITELKHTIVLTKKSRLVVSAMIDIFGMSCPICSASEGNFVVRVHQINNVYAIKGTGVNFVVNRNTASSITISNLMTDADPGTYEVRCVVFKHSSATSGLVVEAKHSSVMVIPLE